VTPMPKGSFTVPCISCGGDVHVKAGLRTQKHYEYQLQCVKCYEQDPEKLVKRAEAAEREWQFLVGLLQEGRRIVISKRGDARNG
jgi:hypothetical protein